MSVTVAKKPGMSAEIASEIGNPLPQETVQSVNKLIEAVKNFKEQQTETLENLHSAREYHKNAIEDIDKLLADLGYPEQSASTQVAIAPTLPTKTRGSGPRNGRPTTIAGGVEGLLLKYDQLSRPDITVKMLKEVGYKNSSGDETDFANTIYTGGINKLVNEGKVITLGTKPNTVYKHISKATPLEIAEYKTKKAEKEARRESKQ